MIRKTGIYLGWFTVGISYFHFFIVGGAFMCFGGNERDSLTPYDDYFLPGILVTFFISLILLIWYILTCVLKMIHNRINRPTLSRDEINEINSLLREIKNISLDRDVLLKKRELEIGDFMNVSTRLDGLVKRIEYRLERFMRPSNIASVDDIAIEIGVLIWLMIFPGFFLYLHYLAEPTL